MKLTQPILGGILVAQLAVAAALFVQQRSNASVRPDGLLFTADAGTIDKLVIEGEDASVEVIKSGDIWQLAGEEALPVIDTKADAVVESIAAARTGWAVANRKDSHPQLEVAEEDFNRRLSLFEGEDKLAEIYVGSSPGLRRSHVRRADENDVYTVALNAYDLPAESSQWLDRSLLSIDDLSSITLSEHKLESTDEGWALSTLTDESLVSQSESVESFINRLKSLRVLDKAPGFDITTTEPVAEITAGLADGDLTYQFFESEEDRFVKRSDFSTVFSINNSDFEALAQLEIDSLLEVEEPQVQTEGEVIAD